MSGLANEPGCQRLGEDIIGYAHALKIHALGRLGVLLDEMEKATGKAGPGRGKAGAKVGRAFTSAPTLADLGVSRKVSSVAQQLSDLLAMAAKAQKALKIYGKVLQEAKITGVMANRGIAMRLRAERVAGDALQSIEREERKGAGRPATGHKPKKTIGASDSTQLRAKVYPCPPFNIFPARYLRLKGLIKEQPAPIRCVFVSGRPAFSWPGGIGIAFLLSRSRPTPVECQAPRPRARSSARRPSPRLRSLIRFRFAVSD